MKHIRLVAGIMLVAVIIAVGFAPRAVVRAASKVMEVLITNTAANPVPIAGSVDVANLPATQQVRVACGASSGSVVSDFSS
jgi:hypothetical protein